MIPILAGESPIDDPNRGIMSSKEAKFSSTIKVARINRTIFLVRTISLNDVKNFFSPPPNGIPSHIKGKLMVLLRIIVDPQCRKGRRGSRAL
ncbi:MAG: hypothetical protein QW638_03435 [Candidatus Bathyarchaeia archaeon]